MFIFPFARSYPAYKWPVGEYILPPRLLCVWERACTIPPRLPLDCIPVIRITGNEMKEKKENPKRIILSLTPVPCVQDTRWRVYLSSTALVCARAWVTSSNGYLSIPSGRKAEGNGFPLDSILGGKGGKCLSFFSLSCLFPTGSTGETQDGSLGTRDKGYCCLVLFSSSAFFGSEAPDPPLGERGGQEGWTIVNTYLVYLSPIRVSLYLYINKVLFLENTPF